jgi:antirestriction protein
MSDLITPRIYVACLASYNNGVLHGAWIDCDGKDADELQDEVNVILRTSRFPNVTVEVDGVEVPSAEEFAIHDHEGFFGLVGEYTPLSDVADIAEVLTSDEDTRIGFLWLMKDRGADLHSAIHQADDVRTFTSDQHDLAAEYAQEVAEETIEGLDQSKWPFNCIDWHDAGKELAMGGDIDTFELDGDRYLITNASAF